MRLIRSNYHALQVLGQAGAKHRKTTVNSCDIELLIALSEIILNVLNGRVTLSNCGKRKLQKHKTALRRLADKRVATSAKRRYIFQSGGFLLPLVGAVLPTIAFQNTNMLRKCISYLQRTRALLENSVARYTRKTSG
jgi:hypothetical protein